ncbi:UDP-glycosyltransferase 88B1-like [Aegilops tauschii subsp. strangulata]|uniref:Glycosyltransferase n=3 Tax=Aegilops tauschii subsp. strangulata TaxID=200361 RepID=A0A453JRI1_AEGTS|nr:UDP-glycosyltransferase 88B1-like [Aegilops tauschii subsp. strangulata]XP_045084293.1 UDP-glycosyltransferase 88B1-like [Aegilops tauschii subsp. strangulata]
MIIIIYSYFAHTSASPPPIIQSTRTTKMKQTVVLYPGAGVGHFGSMTELAHVFLNHGYDVTMVLIDLPVKSSDSGAAAVERIAAANPSISFHVLPFLPVPDIAASGKHPFIHLLQLLDDYNELLEAILRSIPRERLHSLVLDMFCVAAIDVCAKLGVPVYTFFASGASFLSVMTQFPALIAGRQTGLKDLGDTPLDFLGVPPMPASHLVRELLEHPEEEMCKAITNMWKRNTETMGVLVNTYESLECRAVQSLRDPRCVPGRTLPPIYCVGPLVGNGAKDDDGEAAVRNECLAWLDAQPDRSVVFLCFGSKGTLSADQLKEIAVGLERSGQRFLWVVRTPAGCDDPRKILEVRPEANLDALLPAGFQEQTKDRGLVVRSWTPQVDVLCHPATGAFVTHCGWNSVLEAIAAGVPMLCWPLEAEQKMNKVCMTAEDMGVAVELAGYAEGFVTADELEAKVRLAIEAEDGAQLRKRLTARREEAKAALGEGGSSRAAFVQFLLDVENIGVQRGE